jgi:hypothetical protein
MEFAPPKYRSSISFLRLSASLPASMDLSWSFARFGMNTGPIAGVVSSAQTSERQEIRKVIALKEESEQPQPELYEA